MVVTRQTLIDVTGYKAKDGADVLVTARKIKHTLGERIEVEVTKNGATVQNTEFGTERAAKGYLSDVRNGLARPVR